MHEKNRTRDSNSSPSPRGLHFLSRAWPIFFILLAGIIVALGTLPPSTLGHDSNEVLFLTTQKKTDCSTPFCTATCDNGYYAIAGSCTSTSGTRWSLNGISPNHQSWHCLDYSLNGGSITATVNCMKVGNWSPVPKSSVCRNFIVEEGEQCDNLNDAACPGLCAFNDCQCAPTDGVCGDGVANSFNNKGQNEACDVMAIGAYLNPFIKTAPLSCDDFINPFTTTDPENPIFLKDCIGTAVTCTSTCGGFDISKCKSNCSDSSGIGAKGGYPPGNYLDPNHPSNIGPSGASSGNGKGEPGGLVCGMSDPQRVNSLGFPIGKDWDGDGDNVDEDSGEECDGGTPAQQKDTCEAFGTTCSEGKVPQCSSGCSCECVDEEIIDWDGPTVGGLGYPPR